MSALDLFMFLFWCWTRRRGDGGGTTSVVVFFVGFVRGAAANQSADDGCEILDSTTVPNCDEFKKKICFCFIFSKN